MNMHDGGELGAIHQQKPEYNTAERDFCLQTSTREHD